MGKWRRSGCGLKKWDGSDFVKCGVGLPPSECCGHFTGLLLQAVGLSFLSLQEMKPLHYTVSKGAVEKGKIHCGAEEMWVKILWGREVWVKILWGGGGVG